MGKDYHGTWSISEQSPETAVSNNVFHWYEQYLTAIRLLIAHFYHYLFSVSVCLFAGQRASRIPALMVTKQRDEMSIRHKTATFHWQRAEVCIVYDLNKYYCLLSWLQTLAKKLTVLRVLAKRESEMLTRQAVGSSQRRQSGTVEVWTGVKGRPVWQQHYKYILLVIKCHSYWYSTLVVRLLTTRDKKRKTCWRNTGKK